MPDQPPTIVETVVHQLSPPQAGKISLHRTWHIRPNEQSMRYVAQPAWEPIARNAARTLPANQLSRGLIQLATSRLLPRAGDAARDAQDAVSLDDADRDEHWRVATEDIY